jgi:hypothetical protein
VLSDIGQTLRAVVLALVSALAVGFLVGALPTPSSRTTNR